MTAQSTTLPDSQGLVPRNFSLFRGGLLYGLGRQLGLVGDDRRLIRLGLWLAAVTWIPLVVLNSLHGAVTHGSTIPFWESLGTHVRLLVALPLFFFAEDSFDLRVPDVLRRLLEMRLILPKDQPAFGAAIRRAMRVRDAWWIEVTLYVVTGAFVWAGLRTDLPLNVSTWRTSPDGAMTLAGWWYTLVSIPIFQFLFWRWCWRLLVWTQFLWRLSRMNVQLIPTHPDRAGGLAILGVAHVDLAPLGFASCAILSSTYAEEMLFGGVAPAAFAVPLTAAVVGTTVTLIMPLLFFVPRLVDTKQRGLLEYGTLAATYTREFADKWVYSDRPQHEPMLGTPDLQSLADLGSSYDLIRSMTIVPISLRQITLLAGAAALAFVPLVPLAFPLDQLIIDTMRSFLHV